MTPGPVEIWPEEAGPDARSRWRYASGTVLKLDMPEDKGPRMGGIFTGEKGKIEINRNRLASNPVELIRDAPPPADKSEYASVSQHDTSGTGYLACGRARRQSRPFAVGHRADDDLPPDQHLPRTRPQAAMGSRQGGIRGRRASQCAALPHTPAPATSCLRSWDRLPASPWIGFQPVGTKTGKMPIAHRFSGVSQHGGPAIPV